MKSLNCKNKKDNFDRNWGWILGIIMFIPLYLMPALTVNMPFKFIIGGFVVFVVINFIIHYFLFKREKNDALI